VQQEVTFVVHVDGPVGLDGIVVAFDDERAVAYAGAFALHAQSMRDYLMNGSRS
jgi:hypothetical protein